MKSGAKGTSVYKEVMLVDDDPIDMVINEKMLTGLHFTEKTIRCASATDALGILARRLKDGLSLPEIILLDYFMPEMDGGHFIGEFQKLRTAHADKQPCVIVVLTALRSPEKKKALSENPSVLMVANKPLTQKILEEIHQSILSQA
jgi:CheY-like chemotaxis protein